MGLCTSVKALLGASAIIPAFGMEPDKSMVNADIRSRDASTILSAGAIVPVELVDSGLEINARNLMPLGTCLVLAGVLDPHDSRPVHPIKKNRRLILFFNPETPKGMSNSELDAEKRIIAELLEAESKASRPVQSR